MTTCPGGTAPWRVWSTTSASTSSADGRAASSKGPRTSSMATNRIAYTEWWTVHTQHLAVKRCRSSTWSTILKKTAIPSKKGLQRARGASSRFSHIGHLQVMAYWSSQARPSSLELNIVVEFCSYSLGSVSLEAQKNQCVQRL